MTEPEVTKFNADLNSLLAEVRNHESLILTKVTQVSIKPAGMTEFEKTSCRVAEETD